MYARTWLPRGGCALALNLLSGCALQKKDDAAESAADADLTGTINVQAHVDIDDSKMTQLEDVTVKSRWNATCAGRADITISGGDLPTSISEVDAEECCGTDFTESYYTDSVGYAPSSRSACACAC